MKYWKVSPIPNEDYYAVIFSSTKSSNLEGYEEMDERILKLAVEQSGFLGYESAGDKMSGIFISYWQDKEAIQKWKENVFHQEAKSLGISKWYDRFLSQICLVEHTNHFER